jgi:hypothetical protein
MKQAPLSSAVQGGGMVELRHGQMFSERAERTASRIGGALLFLLAAYVTTAAVWHLWNYYEKSCPGR